MRTGCSLTVCRSLLLGGEGAWIWSPLNSPLGCGPGSDPPSISPLGVGLDLIPLNFPLGVGLDLIPLNFPLGVGLDLMPINFPLGCGPGSDPPQFPPWVWPGPDPLNFPLGCGPGPDPPQFPPWVWAWIWSPSISPLGVGLDLIPLNFPLGCGPGGVLSWPFVVVFCYGLLVWWPSDWRRPSGWKYSSVMAFWCGGLLL